MTWTYIGEDDAPAGRSDVSVIGHTTPFPAHRAGTWASVVRPFATLALGEASARLIGVAAILLLARRVPPGDFGLVMLGFTLTVWFSICVDAGTETAGIRAIARTPDRLADIAAPILGLRLALSMVAVAVFVAVAWTAATRPGDRVLLVLFAAALPATAVNLRTMAVSAGESTVFGLGNVAGQLVFLLGVVVAARDAHQLLWVPVLKAAGELCFATVIALRLRPRFGLVRPRVDIAEWRTILRGSAPLLLSSIASVVTFSSGVLVLGFMASRDDVGLYAAAHRPVVFSAGVSGLLLVSFLASYSAVEARREAHRIFRRTVGLAVLSIPGALAVSLTSRLLLRLAYGAAYEAAAPVLALLIWVVPVILVGGPWGIALVARHHQSVQLRNNVIGAAVTIAGTVAGVMVLGIEGAAGAALVAQLLVVVLNYRASVGRDLAPGVDMVVLGRSWRRTTAC